MLHRVRAVLLAFGLLACRASAPGPVDTVSAYAQALRDARYADAWQMLSGAARQSMPYEQFERLAREHPDELRDAVTAYERVDPRAPVTARLELASGDPITLLYEDGEWRIDPSALEFYGQSTARQALQSFVRAVQRERWDVLLRLAPRSVADQLRAGASSGEGPRRPPEEVLRDAWTGQRGENDRRVLGLLQEALDRSLPIETAGNRATMTYGAARQHVARLVREDGVWKVEDID